MAFALEAYLIPPSCAECPEIALEGLGDKIRAIYERAVKGILFVVNKIRAILERIIPQLRRKKAVDPETLKLEEEYKERQRKIVIINKVQKYSDAINNATHEMATMLIDCLEVTYAVLPNSSNMKKDAKLQIEVSSVWKDIKHVEQAIHNVSSFAPEDQLYDKEFLEKEVKYLEDMNNDLAGYKDKLEKYLESFERDSNWNSKFPEGTGNAISKLVTLMNSFSAHITKLIAIISSSTMIDLDQL